MLVLKRKEFASVLIPPKILGGVPEVKTTNALFGGINNTQIRQSNRVGSNLSNLVGKKLDRNFSKLEAIVEQAKKAKEKSAVRNTPKITPSMEECAALLACIL